ncbi:hypothetical protein HPG69_012835 [Diceros bicornis minor]|uniref:Uncharacterized protein n=1 Tax=Diceros bicornis minor TaxID=77932 RepID=A0A7J7F0W6_DICBM|nr:hypothetical protein HPG69_012835 [Diceros bicornis minor]
MMGPPWMGRLGEQQQSWRCIWTLPYGSLACGVISHLSASQSHSVFGQPGHCHVRLLPSEVLPRLGAPQTYSMSGQLGHYCGRSLPRGVLPCLGAPQSQSLWTPPHVVTVMPLSGTSTQEPISSSETSPPKTRPAGLPCPHRSPHREVLAEGHMHVLCSMRQHPPQMDEAIGGISRHGWLYGGSLAVAALPCGEGCVCVHV